MVIDCNIHYKYIVEKDEEIMVKMNMQKLKDPSDGIDYKFAKY